MIPKCIKQKQLEEKVNSMIETITNDNGTAIKFADGTMICTGYPKSGDYDSNTMTYIATWTFPVAFISEPLVIGNTYGGNAKIYTNMFQTNKAYAIIQTKCLGTSGTIEACDRSANCFAIGRWK